MPGYRDKSPRNGERNNQLRFVDAASKTFSDIKTKMHMSRRASSDMAPNNHNGQFDRHEHARAAGEYADGIDIKDPRMIPAMLMSRLPDYAHALMTLPDKRDHRHRKRFISKEVREQEVEKTIAYNDVLRDIIDNHPHIQEKTLVRMASACMMRMGFDDHERELVIDRTRGDLKGMRHELAVETALIFLPEGFEIVETDDGDDAEGADFKVRCPNGVVVSIDVKATPRLEDEATERRINWASSHGRKIPKNEIIMYSGFELSDFDENNNPWRPTQNSIDRVLPYIERRLLEASGDHSTPVNSLAQQY